MAEPHWTPKMVAVYLEEAADTLRRLPNRRVGGYASAWPEIVRDYWEAFGWHDAEVRPIPPSPKAIDQMDRALPWLYWLEPEEAKLVWERACGVPWKIIEIRQGMSRSTAWRHWVTALATIAARLNAGDVPAIALNAALTLRAELGKFPAWAEFWRSRVITERARRSHSDEAGSRRRKDHTK